jgi:hypothetical protein
MLGVHAMRNTSGPAHAVRYRNGRDPPKMVVLNRFVTQADELNLCDVSTLQFGPKHARSRLAVHSDMFRNLIGMIGKNRAQPSMSAAGRKQSL